jgi:gas vesicle protein
MYNNKTIIAGAIIGTLIGSLSAVLRNNRKNIFSQINDQTNDWTNKAHHISKKVLNGMDRWRRPPNEIQGQTFVTGALCGLLVGLGSALLFAPKSGKQLRNDLTKTYNTMAGKTQEILQFINHEPLVKNRSSVKNTQHPGKAKAKSHAKK